MSKAAQIRIIGGQWRGSKLPVANSEGLRPTGDRVRETLFNWLAADLYDARCLDLFAGSGALGFEALSRGANAVEAYETSKIAIRNLEANRDKLDADNYTLFKHSALEKSPPGGQTYDLVFLDPPFGQGLMQQAINWLVKESLLAEGSLIYIEQASEDAEPDIPDNWHCRKTKQFGAVNVWLYRCLS